MTGQVTLNLPEKVLRSAEVWAKRLGRPVDAFLADTISHSLGPTGEAFDEDVPVEQLSDKQVLETADSQMPPGQDQRLSELLYRQQARLLIPEERNELAALMRCYEIGLLRKAQAMAEAVQRGLRERIQP